jgi:hypothetical protein
MSNCRKRFEFSLCSHLHVYVSIRRFHNWFDEDKHLENQKVNQSIRALLEYKEKKDVVQGQEETIGRIFMHLPIAIGQIPRYSTN